MQLFLSISLIFPLVVVFLQIFYFFNYFFIFFSEQETHRMEAKNVSALTELRCGLQKISHVL
jgi:heme/copper-type cytochrome/quinol oxidase subunit 2